MAEAGQPPKPSPDLNRGLIICLLLRKYFFIELPLQDCPDTGTGTEGGNDIPDIASQRDGNERGDGIERIINTYANNYGQVKYCYENGGTTVDDDGAGIAKLELKG
ncbi:hypothetical protein ATZ36_12345 [Candidatus Endomicrobiellum trichonymphae]|uniref:Uncharacterized protein n=1 Tax=Endomicrobium trichonymphae TaxID=1408204 RepID=A0A1E5IMX9_ENDTX|nr:hypothetical protein ATZ36_12345 [Candidatus Endomicrobium trichonymphae]